tara:strand:+ start:1015 stop:1551 length:537 start_codon:yes stop_codon:yes gene_type:complete
MKNVLKIIGVFVLAFVGYITYMLINPVSPKETVGYSSDNASFEVVYSRPYKKGRLIFGSEEDGALVPFGKYWRTGANAATTFETSSEISFNGEPLKAGKYALFTFPYEDNWTVALSSESDVFFAISHPDPKLDVLKTSVDVKYLESPLEQFTIEFSKDSTYVNMSLMWDKTSISIPLE